MIHINYQKRKNQELFKSLEDSNTLFLSKTQNYIPIYKRFFSLNETNFNNINLNHKWHITNVKENIEDNKNLFSCKIKNINTQKSKEREVFFKSAPLLDPYKYLIGKYTINDKLFKLPDIESDATNTNTKFTDINNSAYVDGFFSFLTSNLIHDFGFIHGVDYYGSFLAIKNEYKINVFDDLEYLTNSDYFNKNKNVLFTIDDYEHLCQTENVKLKPLNIQHNLSLKSNLSIHSFNEDVFENIFSNETINSNENNNILHLDDLKDLSIDLLDITNNLLDSSNEKTTTLKSGSTCSSRTSHTSTENSNNENDDCNNCDNDNDDDDIEHTNTDENTDENTCENTDESSSDTSSEEEEVINVTIPKFPIQLICMEYCENTFDDLILSNELTPEEWYSAFMQIIMMLITYQKAYAFTHNDLHTNNVMYVNTNKKYIYYLYKKKYYKVPTFGRLYKIIDFGRSIYKFNGNLFCSDSFQLGGDAASQYNTEPYFNDKKPRLEPNYSFDLCRLACSIFDYLIEDIDEIKELDKCDPIKRLIVEWCLDDKGINLLYKNNGSDRYPDFKLYKMIARHVHNHTPQAQLERPEFKQFEVKLNINPDELIDIDKIPSLV